MTAVPADPQPPSLRARKKTRQAESILAAAADLFRAAGFERTRVEDIATAAEVSAATVYNYFPTKQQILMGIFRKEMQRTERHTAALLEAPPADPAEALTAIVVADIGDMDGKADKKLWRGLLSAMISDEENGREIEAIRALFRRNLRRLVALLAERGDLKPTVDQEALTDIVYAIYAYHFRQLICTPTLSTRAAMKLVRRDLHALLAGMLA